MLCGLRKGAGSAAENQVFTKEKCIWNGLSSAGAITDWYHCSSLHLPLGTGQCVWPSLFSPFSCACRGKGKNNWEGQWREIVRKSFDKPNEVRNVPWAEVKDVPHGRSTDSTGNCGVLPSSPTGSLVVGAPPQNIGWFMFLPRRTLVSHIPGKFCYSWMFMRQRQDPTPLSLLK